MSPAEGESAKGESAKGESAGSGAALGAVVVGTGFGCITHVRALRAAGFDVRAIVGRDPDRTQKRAGQFGVDRAFTTLEDALAIDGVDAVMPEQQIVTLEEMLPHLQPGGVFLCEDIHGLHNRFTAYLQGLIDHLNSLKEAVSKVGSTATPFQAEVHSIHSYPYVSVIEKRSQSQPEFTAPKHGTEWQPFL